jgi:glycosyltransferase involved in cell wall biosynthesis
MLVIGNGATGVDRDGRRYIHEGTGRFLADLNRGGLATTYVEIATRYARNSNLQNFCLDEHGIGSLLVPLAPKLAKLRALAAVARRVVAADHVYAFYPGTLPKGAVTLRLLSGRPFGLYVRGAHYRGGVLDALILRRAAFAFTVSPGIEADLRGTCRSTGTIRPMLSMGVGDRVDRPPARSAPARWSILFVGRLEEDKGVREVLEAARILKSRRFPFHLRVVGGGPMFDAVRDAGSASDLAGAVDVVGEVMTREALLAEYAAAHLFVCASYHEGFPRVLYEAMLASLPIITTFVGGIPGRMQDGVNCLRIPERDPEAIAAAIERLTSDLRLLDRLGRAGQSTVLSVLRDQRPHAELLMEMVGGRD